MTERERQQRAQDVYQAALQAIAHEFGVSIEPSLQVEAVSNSYATTRAVLVIKLIPGWHSSVDVPSDET